MMVSLALPFQAPAAATVAPKPNISLKRTHAEVDYDETLSPPRSKRPRVTFDMNVQVQVLPDWNMKSRTLVREEVILALKKYDAGESFQLDYIKELFTTTPSSADAPSSALLTRYVSVLAGLAIKLGGSRSSLAHCILQTPWVLRSDEFVECYAHFLGSLLTAQTLYLEYTLQHIVRNFVQLPSPASGHPEDPRCTRPEMLDRTHKCLKYLLRLIPSASTLLKSTLTSAFPHPSDTVDAHIDYIKNILRIPEYAPELKALILSLIVERLVKIDIQIQADIEELDDDFVEELIRRTHHDEAQTENRDDSNDPDNDEDTEENEDVDDDEGSDDEEDDEEDDDNEMQVEKLKNSFVKLDGALDLLFKYYESMFSDTSDPNADPFEHLLIQFNHLILPTQGSRHMQFLLFHFGQLDSTLISRSIGFFAEVVTSRTRSEPLRVSAGAYLAGFVARGAHVDRTIVQDVCSFLCDHLDNLRKIYELKFTSPDLRRYNAYYITAQALLYIFCFRWRDLIEDDVDDEDIQGGQDFTWPLRFREVLHRNARSKLNPLKVCSQDIVQQYAAIANYLQFDYVYTILEKNTRIRLVRTLSSTASYSGLPERQGALSFRSGDSALQLDAYFPFDPYRLPVSKRWLDGDYNEWRSVPGMGGPVS